MVDKPKREMPKLVIAIDGPAGSGKSTTAKAVAARLGFTYLDTGAMYRAVTLKAIREGVDLSDGDQLAELTRKLTIRFDHANGEQRVLMDDEDVTKAIRTPEVTKGTSPVSAQPQVRKLLVERQKEIGRNGGIVVEGRDTTSVVFPDADLKIYLIADVKERAQRRLQDLQQLGVESSLSEQIELLAKRDQADSSRRASPLTKVEGAIEVDTTNLTIDQQVQKIVDLAHQVAAV